MVAILIERDPQVCDFCTSADPVTAYQCDDFVWAKDSILPHQSDGAWAACAECAELIDASRWPDLTDRAMVAFIKAHGVPFIAQPSLRTTIMELHGLFRQHKRLAA